MNKRVLFVMVLVFIVTAGLFLILKPDNPDLKSGDLNKDGMIDSLDYSLFMAKFGSSCEKCEEDLNSDGLVNGLDYQLFLGQFTAASKE